MKRFKEHYRLSAKSVGPILNNLINKNLKDHGFVSADIMQLWRQIVDQSLVNESHPYKMTRAASKQHNSGYKGQTQQTITVKCSQGAYLLLSYQKEHLINRLNQHLGFAAIADIKFIKASALTKAKIQPNQPNHRTISAKTHRQTTTQDPLDQALLKLKALQKREIET